MLVQTRVGAKFETYNITFVHLVVSQQGALIALDSNGQLWRLDDRHEKGGLKAVKLEVFDY